MVGKMVFHVEKETIIETAKGPLLRFDCSFGFVQEDVVDKKNAEAYLTSFKGCICRQTYGKWTWTPAMSMIRGKYWQYAKVTPNIHDKILQCLEQRGALKPYLELREKYAILNPRNKNRRLRPDELAGEEAKYVVEG